MSWVATAITVGGAIVGGIAGSQKDVQSGSSSSGITLTPETDLEKQGTRMTGEGLTALEGMVNAGPGQADVTGAYNQSNALASLLNDFAQSGGAPGQQDILQANQMADLQFKPQQVALDQSFQAEQERAKQMAAQLGRPVNDPYIQAQLSKQRMQSMEMMGAQRGAFVGQQSQQQAMQRLGFTSQLTDVRNALGSQAMANRQALLSLGQGVQQSERNFRLQTGTRWGNQTQESGGGMAGGLMGGLMGAGAGMGLANSFSSFQANNTYTKNNTPQGGGGGVVMNSLPPSAATWQRAGVGARGAGSSFPPSAPLGFNQGMGGLNDVGSKPWARSMAADPNRMAYMPE